MGLYKEERGKQQKYSIILKVLCFSLDAREVRKNSPTTTSSPLSRDPNPGLHLVFCFSFWWNSQPGSD
jgi:hypothetical protein